MNAIFARYRGLPVIGKTLVWAVVALVAFYGVVAPLLDFADSVGGKAGRLESALARRASLASDDAGDGQFLAAARGAFGRPQMPGEGAARPETVYRVVDGILAGHGVTDRSITESKTRLTGDHARALGAGEIDRLMLVVSFEAEAPTVASILAEMEKSKEIAAVSRVKIDRSGVRAEGAGDDVVRATIVPEAWFPAARSEGVSQ